MSKLLYVAKIANMSMKEYEPAIFFKLKIKKISDFPSWNVISNEKTDNSLVTQVLPLREHVFSFPL